MMSDKIQIVSWLLTRRCNLKCSYCRISTRYASPKEYPGMNHYYDNEMPTHRVMETLNKLKEHNPDVFILFYGGEPLLRKDLFMIINHCNTLKLNYSIITNNSDAIQKDLKYLFDNTDYISGLTSSVDPLIFSNASSGDILSKSLSGLKRLFALKGKVKDLVAEITVDNNSIDYLYQLVKMLSNDGINSDITFVDIAKSEYYDFSNVTDESCLVQKNDKVKDILNRIIDEKLDVHMSETLLPLLYDSLPSNLDCEIEKNVHNLTIDADGSVRLCLRMRGVMTPKVFDKVEHIFIHGGELSPLLKQWLAHDKEKYCKKCNWSCMIISKLAKHDLNGLLHLDKRK
jgi:MoaA/NifB/PqqE/SkfB family radical SAM enzyme